MLARMAAATELDCPCRARDYRLVLDGRYSRLGYDGYAFRVFECRRCGLARTDPMPDVHLYEEQSYAEAGAFDPGTTDLWSESIAGFVARHASPGRALNVGAATGNLHPPLEARGFEVVGIDIDPAAIAVAQRHGRNVVRADLLEAGFDDASFDVVTMIHTLEHLADPDAIVAEIHRVLRPGGRLFVNVPNRGGALPRIMRDAWIGWVPPHHVWQFTPRTLEALVRRAAPFRTTFLRAVGSMEPPSVGLKGRVKKVVAVAADKVGWGDQVVAVFEKAP